MKKPDRLIQKYPFNGSDKNLIDAFYIVGFEEAFINEVIIPNLPIDFAYQPGILDSITSSEASKISNENLFLKLSYPKNPEVISPNYLALNNMNSKEQTSIIFSFSFDNEKGTSISSYSGYSYLFYEQITSSPSTSNQSITVYIPKAFIIISKFPYFTAFKTICRDVHLYFNKRVSGNVPIEVILYNIVNYTPSPLNCNLTLDLFPHDVIQNKVVLTQLSGYPLVDYNLGHVFALLSVNFVLEIFLLSLFEIDMLFFSKNLELLNMVMYTIYILNYPCNDTIYLWHIVSFTKEDLLTPNHQTGMFVDKLCTMIIGVNCSYEEGINPKQFKNYFVVDIDNKKLIYKTKESLRKTASSNSPVDDLAELQKYFQRIIKEKNVQSSFIEKLIRTLINSLNTLGMESLMINATSFFSSNNKTNLFEFDNVIHKRNRQIQEAFYDFYLKFLDKFYSNYTISYDSAKSSFDDQDKDKSNNRLYYYSYDNEDKGLGKEEKCIMKLFQETNKFSNYFISFVKYFIYKESYNIPLLFSEDLINIQMYLDSSTNATSNLFDLIDAFYLNKQSDRYTLSRQEKEIEYNGFYVNFYSALSNDYVSNKTSKAIRLNRKVLYKYMSAMNDQLESLKEKMMSSYATLKSNSIKSTFSSDIIDMIEEGMTQMNLIDSESLLITSIIIVFSITQFSCPFMFSVTSFHSITSLITKHAFRRKYVFILLLGYYKTLKEFKQRDKNSVLIAKTNYYLLLNFILFCNILPNENMMTVMSLLKKEMEIVEAEKKDELLKEEVEEPIIECGNKHYEIDLLENPTTVLNIKNEIIVNAIKQLKNNKNIEFHFDEKKTKFTPRVRIKISGNTFESILFTPVKLKQMCENLFDRYLAIMKNELIEDIDMKNVIITLVYYTKIFPQLESVRSFLLQILEIIRETVNQSNQEKEKEIENVKSKIE